jgi:hypothetical protein
VYVFIRVPSHGTFAEQKLFPRFNSKEQRAVACSKASDFSPRDAVLSLMKTDIKMKRK